MLAIYGQSVQAIYARLKPTLILTAHCDPVRPQGELYAATLRDAGVAVQHVSCPALPHGFFQLPHVLDRAAEIVHRTGASLGAALDATAGPQPGGPSPR